LWQLVSITDLTTKNYSLFMIPKNIKKEDLLKAISKIDKEGIPKDGASQYYDVVYNGKTYPPKIIVSYANIFANGTELDRNSFSGGLDTQCFKLLEENDFVIVKKSEMNFRNYWIEKTIVNGRPDRLSGERALGKALWSPQKAKDGADIYKNMRQVKQGDIVLHLINNKLFSGISIVKEIAIETNGISGTGWEGPAYLIELKDYSELNPPIDRTDFLTIRNKILLDKISRESEVFYNNKLDLRQGAYLTPCPIELLHLINETFKTKSKKDLPFLDKINLEKLPIESYRLNFNNLPMKSINHFVSIKTKPFIILAGLSGTGKSRLVRTLAYQFNNIATDLVDRKNPPTNFQLIKVKPNWHDSSDLLGYESRISGKDRFVATDFIRFIVKAYQHPDTPFFLCLDEMNLAPVEQYFAEYLSAIETRRVNDGKIKTDALINGKLLTKYADKLNGVDASYELWNELELDDTEIQNELKANGLGLPSNLIVMGTVNMDETTHSFSRKVLDRAMTIEMNDINLSEGLSADTNDWNYPAEPLQKELVLSEKTQGTEVFAELSSTGGEIISYLDLINTKLEGSPFKIAYRVRDEFLLYAFNYSLLENKPNNWKKNVLDEMTLMKILPRIEGDEDRTKLLDDLIILFREYTLPKSLDKATEMATRRRLSHYTSFWS